METHGINLGPVVALLAAGVIAVAVFRRLGLGSVLGYLAAGVAIGPFGLKLFTDPGAILHVAELGVVMFLFVIGLEMQPSRLWSLRKQIFGVGAAQVLACGALLTTVGVLVKLPPRVAFFAAMGFVLSSTAIVAQILNERGDTSTPQGQRVFSILLMEDLAIVPLLALVAVLAPGATTDGATRWREVGIGFAAVIVLVAAGRYLLNPMFRLLSMANAREAMTAAALLVVLGAALVMQVGGLSMAMGAFLAGVLLSESTFRHQLEADIEPFRGLLLGLFFLGVGMSLDLSLVIADYQTVLFGVLAFMTTKSLGVYTIARLTKTEEREAVYRGAMLTQGGEFAFVLYAAAAAVGIFSPRIAATFTAVVILSMALTPFVVAAERWLPGAEASMDGIERAEGLRGRVLIIGFGRFGQVMSQGLLARGVDVTIIDTDIEMIRAAANFGFKVYYGDGTRLDVLYACGAATSEAIAVCVENRAAATKIVEIAKAEFPLVRVWARSFDRGHSLELVNAGADFQVRETFESALAFGNNALLELGVPSEEAAEIIEEVRRRDTERFELELVEGLGAGKALLHGNAPKPTPFTPPSREARALNEEAAAAAGMSQREDAV
jgi:glutathione-regulated potassium-efflux system protein KefB